MACKITKNKVTEQSALEHETTVLNQIIESARVALNLEFRKPITRENEFKNKRLNLREKRDFWVDENKLLTDKLKDKDTKGKDKVAYKQKIRNNKKKIKEFDRRIEYLDRQIKDEPASFEIKKKIIGLVQDRLVKLADGSLLSVKDFDSYAQVINWHLRKRFIGYGSLDTADKGTLNAIYNHLNDIYTAQDNQKVFGEGLKGQVMATMYDPALAVLKFDKGLQAVDFVEDSYETLGIISQISNRHKNSSKDALDKLDFLIRTENLLFDVEAADPDNPTKDNYDQSLKNAGELIHDILDGRTRYIVPKTINTKKIKNAKNAKERSKILLKEIGGIETINKISKIVDYAIKSGVEKDIHKVPGQDLWYVMIMEEVDGKEVWNAYLVPTDKIVNGRPRFIFPKTRGKKPKLNPRFAKEFINLNDTYDLTEIATEGYYTAGAEPEIFEGTDKYKNKFFTKGYTNYESNDALNNMDPRLQEGIFEAVDTLRINLK